MTMPKLPGLCLLLAVMLAVSACSSGSSPGESLQFSPVANRPPSLSGTPPSTAVQDVQYNFKPVTNDPDGDPLAFAITNVPAWATFDSATGALSGMPSMQHIGITRDITISVSDGQGSAELPPFDIEVVASAIGSLSLSWTPPTQSADGSPLSDLASYHIRWGTQSGNLPNLQVVDNPGVSSFVIEGLAAGNYFFTVAAVDTSNNESQPSNEASGTVQ